VGYPDEGFMVFLGPSREEVTNASFHILPHSSFIIILQMLYNVYSWNRVV
jgi:hypothetical protein